MSRCIQSNVADSFFHGRLATEEFARVLKHASGCDECRHLLFTTSRPNPELPISSMDEIQERLTTWRAARRAPLMPAFPWRKGREVDRFVIIRSVGGTEDGVIYEAFDPEREARVVVKQLDLHIEDPATPALMTLAQKLTQLNHPGLLQMLSVGVHEGFVYFVYEFVKGTTLLHAGIDEPRQIIALFAEAGRGLSVAHAAGITHSCFSPASCVVGRDGKVKVLDFGIGEARIHRVAATRTMHDADWSTGGDPISAEDSFVGFVPGRSRPPSGQFEAIILAAGPNSLGPRLYAAPELVLGAAPTPASDQFSFCAALFHRLYGHPPYQGDTIALWLRELLKGGRIPEPPVLASVPPGVNAVLLRGLERDPAARFEDMATLLAKLKRHIAVPGRRRRVLAAVAVGAAVVAAAGIGIEMLRGGTGAASPHGCDHTFAGWDELWSTRRQDAIAQAAGPSAAEAIPALRARIDGWVDAWRTATQEFCSMPPERPQAAECASRAHALASDLLQLVQDGSPARVTVAASAVEALPTYDQCLTTAPSPASAPLAVVQADVRRRLGMFDEADQLTSRPTDDPAQRGYQSLVRGHTALDRGDLMAARRLFEDATFEAQAAHQPELGVTAALQRLALSCAAPERALWTGYLDAQSHLADKALPQAEYRAALAQSLSCEGKFAEAVKLRQQVAAAQHADDAAAAAGLDLARALLLQGEFAQAEAAAGTATATFARLYGPRHPLTRAARLAVAEAQLPSPATTTIAEQVIAHMIADLRDRKEPDALRARALLLQGQLAESRGDRDDALHLVQRATQEYEAALGGTHPELAGALLAAGDLLLATGHDQEAEADYRQVAAIFDTLGQSDSAHLAHARAGIQLARWRARPPADAADTLQWGITPTGGTADPAVTGWIAAQLGRIAAARGDQAAALAQYRAAAAAWQQSGNRRGLSSALSAGALLAVALRAPDARAMLEEALQIGPVPAVTDRPRLQGALARLLWPAQRDRARSLARAALADLPDGSSDATDLKQWLKYHGAER